MKTNTASSTNKSSFSATSYFTAGGVQWMMVVFLMLLLIGTSGGSAIGGMEVSPRRHLLVRDERNLASTEFWTLKNTGGSDDASLRTSLGDHLELTLNLENGPVTLVLDRLSDNDLHLSMVVPEPVEIKQGDIGNFAYHYRLLREASATARNTRLDFPLRVLDYFGEAQPGYLMGNREWNISLSDIVGGSRRLSDINPRNLVDATRKPTTARPTTKRPTRLPSTLRPTPPTRGPTTRRPSTRRPTLPTRGPTSRRPSTRRPTLPTRGPTTRRPTTTRPTRPTTFRPTRQPTTAFPTTRKPSKSPTTRNPTTRLPTKLPTTRRPTTRSPTKAPTYKCTDKFLSTWNEAPNGADTICPLYSTVTPRDYGIVCMCPYSSFQRRTAYYDGTNTFAGNIKRNVKWSVFYGPRTNDCLGRCGPGCNDDDKQATRNCLEHDVCIEHFGGTSLVGNPNCQNEFENGIDDTLVTIFNVCC